MSLYEGVAFQGTFRDYQQRVLDNAQQYIAKGKLNIVTPFGSGKTILGLELIRRIGEACLIVSPTVATRDHWGKRLREHFLAEESRFEEFFSTDVERAGIINAITYEELAESMEAYASDGEKKVFKLRRMIRERKINTICLDEPHHLKDKYISALGRLQELLEKDEKFLYITTTPPCEYEEAEWQQFTEVCGEIDVQIPESELVAEEVFCPHQDYIYFNEPSEEEEALLYEHMERVQVALEELGKLPSVQASIEWANQRKSWYWTYHYNFELSTIKERAAEAYIPILQLLRYYGFKHAERLEGRKEFPPIQIKDMQIALQYLTGRYEILKEHRKFILQVLRKYDLYEKKMVQLVPDELMHKALTTSVGKFNSIRDIVNREYQTLGKDLRLLVFTEEEHVMNIFEVLHSQETDVKIGVLGKNLLILPIREELRGTMMIMEPVGDTGYGKVEFFGDTSEATDIVKNMLREGRLQVLIGDQTLLNEDWVESGINSVILPGFSRDFFQNNAMRGIILKADHPEKIVNIWHLTTLLPMSRVEHFRNTKIQREYLESYDLKMVKDRFRFVREPGFETGEMERMINRILLTDSPFDSRELQQINRKMLEYSVDRENIRRLWKENIMSKSKVWDKASLFEWGLSKRIGETKENG